jgi:hypothetical protein
MRTADPVGGASDLPPVEHPESLDINPFDAGGRGLVSLEVVTVGRRHVPEFLPTVQPFGQRMQRCPGGCRRRRLRLLHSLLGDLVKPVFVGRVGGCGGEHQIRALAYPADGSAQLPAGEAGLVLQGTRESRGAAIRGTRPAAWRDHERAAETISGDVGRRGDLVCAHGVPPIWSMM